MAQAETAVEAEKTPSQDEISAALEKYIADQTAAGNDVDLTKISPETIASLMNKGAPKEEKGTITLSVAQTEAPQA